MDFYPSGTRIAGRYEVAGQPLVGGIATIYVCFDHQDQRPVALKTFKPEYLPNRAARDRFLQAGTTWIGLRRHPHIVCCHGVERIDDRQEVYLVLELVAKEQRHLDASLRSRLIPGKPLSLELTLLFGLQIARGMSYVTATVPGLVHRNLKPENVLVGIDQLSKTNISRLRVTDFGLVNVLECMDGQQSHITDIRDNTGNMIRTQVTHGIVGTPLYMAPEQWQNEELTVQTDMYAFGCILYEMLTGHPIVSGNGLNSLKQAHCRGELPSLPADLPEEVREMVSCCLAREPGGRYGSWDIVKAAVSAVYAEVSGKTVPEVETLPSGQRERIEMGWSYIALGTAYTDTEIQTALGYFERAQNIGNREGEQQLERVGLMNLGTSYMLLGDLKKATEFYHRALAIADEVGDRYGEGDTLGNLGLAYQSMGDVQKAIVFFTRYLQIAIELGDHYGRGAALSNLGRTYALQGDLRRAIEYYEHAIEVLHEIGDRQNEEQVFNNLGNAYQMMGNTQRAIECHKRTLAIASEIGDRRGQGAALGNLGNIYRTLGDAQQAMPYLEQALAIHREIGDVMGIALSSTNIALLCIHQGELSRALLLAYAAAELFARIGLVQYAERAMRVVEQVETIIQPKHDNEVVPADPSRATEIGVGSAQDYCSLGNVHRDLQQYEEALGCYTQAIELDPNLAEAHCGRGIIFIHLQQYEMAQEDFCHAIRLDPNNASAYFYRGTTFVISKQYELAQRDFSCAVQLDPSNVAAYFNRGTTYTLLEQDEAALADFSRAIELDPNDATTYYNRGTAYRSLQQHKAAVADFSHAIELAPNFAEAYVALLELVLHDVPPEHRPFLEQRLAQFRQIAGKQRTMDIKSKSHVWGT